MSVTASQITENSTFFSTVCFGIQQRNIKALCYWPFVRESTNGQSWYQLDRTNTTCHPVAINCWGYPGTLSCCQVSGAHFDGLVQERRNSSALALELHLSCTYPLIWRARTYRFHLQMLNFQMSCSNLTERQGTRIVIPVMATRGTCPIETYSWLAQVIICDLLVLSYHQNWYLQPHLSIQCINTLRLRQNGCHFIDIFKCIFFSENKCILIKINLLKFVPRDPYRQLICSIFMMTSSNGNIFRVTGPLCGEFTGHR